MSLFSRHTDKKETVRPVIRDPFAVVPLRSDTVEMRHDSAGCAHLRMRQEPKGLRKKVADMLGYDYTRKVQLDEYGTVFMGMVDGRNRLHDIVDRMVADSGKDRKEVEEGVVVFTKKLMTMDMIVLKVEN